MDVSVVALTSFPFVWFSRKNVEQEKHKKFMVF